ncbi:protein of unknown function [Candidatus Methylocalor cossyra]|uniref:Uncharacterized protein n=1 Tax=Candidatus Methylocalor cossyra TaxID=3108543 RepID=A0ABM9NIB5_9GAMM
MKHRVITGVNHRFYPVIRGITAPASLKHGEKLHPQGLARRYPGHNCPGLIEAGWVLSKWKAVGRR